MGKDVARPGNAGDRVSTGALIAYEQADDDKRRL